MSALFTSAPWHVEDPLGDDAGDALWIVRDGATPQVYDWRCVAIVTSDDPEESDNPCPISAVERDANARLIATAPEMLEVLYQYLDDLRYPPTGDSLQRRIERAEAVIAKATGK